MAKIQILIHKWEGAVQVDKNQSWYICYELRYTSYCLDKYKHLSDIGDRRQKKESIFEMGGGTFLEKEKIILNL